jgi:hypothetical protein
MQCHLHYQVARREREEGKRREAIYRGEMKKEADDVVVLVAPQDFSAVGEWYGDFDQTTDEEVSELLRGYGGRRGNANLFSEKK